MEGIINSSLVVSLCVFGALLADKCFHFSVMSEGIAGELFLRDPLLFNYRVSPLFERYFTF